MHYEIEMDTVMRRRVKTAMTKFLDGRFSERVATRRKCDWAYLDGMGTLHVIDALVCEGFKSESEKEVLRKLIDAARFLSCEHPGAPVNLAIAKFSVAGDANGLICLDKMSPLNAQLRLISTSEELEAPKPEDVDRIAQAACAKEGADLAETIHVGKFTCLVMRDEEKPRPNFIVCIGSHFCKDRVPAVKAIADSAIFSYCKGNAQLMGEPGMLEAYVGYVNGEGKACLERL